MRINSKLLAYLAPLCLGACATIPAPDRELSRIAEAIGVESASHYAALSAKPTPECAYAANQAAYANLTAQAAQLTTHLSITKASPMLTRAGAALAKAVADARASHELASARSDDAFGLCMAPGAITLNADALTRASAAIASTQNRAGGN